VGRRVLVPALLLAALAAGPAPASAASLTLGRSCYRAGATVEIRGSALAREVPLTVRLDGTPVGTVATDAVGSFAASWKAPQLPAGVRERAFTLDAVDAAGAVLATGTLRVSAFSAEFSPDRGDPRTWRARFSVHGFRLPGGGRTVYLHYVRPGGRLERTVRLGRAQGPCGSIARTRLRRIFPFAATRGTWTLQFDSRRVYRRDRRPSVSRKVRISRVA